MTRRLTLLLRLCGLLVAGSRGSLLAADRVADLLPTIEYAVHDPAATAPLVVLVSGDGGWAEIDEALAEHWQRRGWPVVGVNALKYFWRKRSPDEFARALATLLTGYSDRWSPRPVVLVGFSFGADTIPFAANRLPEIPRRLLAALVLISPTEKSMWEAGLASWLGRDSTDAPVAPEVARLSPLPIMIITGEKDAEAFNGWAERPGLRHEQWPGDHHLDRAYDRLDLTIAGFLTDHAVVPSVATEPRS